MHNAFLFSNINTNDFLERDEKLTLVIDSDKIGRSLQLIAVKKNR